MIEWMSVAGVLGWKASFDNLGCADCSGGKCGEVWYSRSWAVTQGLVGGKGRCTDSWGCLVVMVWFGLRIWNCVRHQCFLLEKRGGWWVLDLVLFCRGALDLVSYYSSYSQQWNSLYHIFYMPERSGSIQFLDISGIYSCGNHLKPCSCSAGKLWFIQILEVCISIRDIQ